MPELLSLVGPFRDYQPGSAQCQQTLTESEIKAVSLKCHEGQSFSGAGVLGLSLHDDSTKKSRRVGPLWRYVFVFALLRIDARAASTDRPGQLVLAGIQAE